MTWKMIASFVRSRSGVLLGISSVGLILLLGTHFRGSVQAAWRIFRIPPFPIRFSDSAFVAYSIDCLKSGQDPYAVCSFMPWHGVYNYPPVWLDLRYVGVSSRSTNWIGILFAMMSVCALLLLFRAAGRVGRILCFFAAMSWPLLFAVERGNIDEVIFFLLVAGFFLTDRLPVRARTWCISLLVVGLTCLKIYPIAAALVMARNRRGAWVALATGAGATVALLVTSGHRLFQILANTPHVVLASYGAFPVTMTLSRHLLPALSGQVEAHPSIASVCAAAMALPAVVCGVAWEERLYKIVPRLDLDCARGRIAASCMAIYWFTFVLGASFDYRLIFLLGILAYLVKDIDSGSSSHSMWAAVFLLIYFAVSALIYQPMIHALPDLLLYLFVCAWLGSAIQQRLRGTPGVRPALAVV